MLRYSLVYEGTSKTSGQKRNLNTFNDVCLVWFQFSIILLLSCALKINQKIHI